MAGKPQKIRKVQFAKVVDFDDQLWPINCAILILAGFVAGIVIATSDFHDPRLIFNGWIRLTGVVLMVGLLFWGVMWLQGKMLRRLQFCVIFSLLFHLWLAMCLHEQYLEMLAETKAREEVTQAARQQHRVPDYNWQHIDNPEIKQEFEKPVETQAPKETAPKEVERKKVEQEVPLKEMPKAEPQEPHRQQPNPAELRRAELSVPRRADKAAGGQISRQQWKHRPQPNEPIPEPSVAPAAPRASTAVNAQATNIQRQETETPVHQRQTYREPQSQRELDKMALNRRQTRPQPRPEAPTTPKPTRETTRPAELPRTEIAQTPADTASVAKTAEPKPSRLTPKESTVKRASQTPVATKRASESAPSTPNPSVPATAMAKSPVRADQSPQQPRLTDTAKASPAKQTPRLNLPNETIESHNAAAKAAATAAKQLTAAESSLARQMARTAPSLARSRTSDTPSFSASASVSPRRPSRSRQTSSPAPTPQPDIPSRAPRRQVTLPQIAPSAVSSPTVAKSASPTSPSAAAQPSTTSVTKALATPAEAKPRSAGRSLPAMTRSATLPATVASRAKSSSRQPVDTSTVISTTASTPSTLTKRNSGVNLPSSIVAQVEETNVAPAAAGSAAPSRIEANTAVAVARSTSAAPTAATTAAAGAARFVIGSAEVVARAGAAKASGSDRPSVAANSPVPRVARANTGTSLSAVPVPTLADVARVASAQERGGQPSPAPNASAASATRGGEATLPNMRRAAGAAAPGSSGSSRQVGISALVRTGRPEANPSGLSGAGTPQPVRKAFGSPMTADAVAEAPQPIEAAPGGAPAAGSPMEASAGGQQRQMAGLPGSRQSQAFEGAAVSLADQGAALPMAAASRAVASQTAQGVPGMSPNMATTIARSDSKIDLPSVVEAVENVPTAGAGGVTASREGLPSTLEAGSTATLKQASANAPSADVNMATATAEFAAGVSQLVALTGQLDAGSRDLPTPTISTMAAHVGRSNSGPAPRLSGVVAEVDATPASEPAARGGETGGELQLAAAYTAVELARNTGAAPGGSKRAETTAFAEQGDPGNVAAARLGRAASSATMPTVEGTLPTSTTGPSRRTGKKAMIDALAAIAIIETDTISDEAAPEAASTATGAEGNLQVASIAQNRGNAAVPSAAGGPSVIDEVPRSDRASSTPGTITGLRHPPSGSDQGPTIAAEMGGGPKRKTDTIGLPRGLAEMIEVQPVDATAFSTPGEQIDVAMGSGVAAPSRREGGLPVQIAAVSGPGGLSSDPSPQLGLPSRRARPESEVIHTVSRRFLIQRSGGELAVDGTISEPTESYSHRDPGNRADMVKRAGGNRGTEAAVEAGLDYFARHQFPDGHWSLHELPEGIEYRDPALGTMQADTAATGLALLTYLGAGYTHLDEKHRAVVRRGVDWLVKNQKPSGSLFTGGNEFVWFYSHGIAAMALCEAYGMTGDHELREPARKAVEFILKTQNPTRGGWRYTLDEKTGRSTETDTSVTGWQLMALKSAQMAGLDVPNEALRKVGHWLDRAEAPDGNGKYVYNPHASTNDESQRNGRRASRAMTAEAMLMRMYLGRGRDDPALIDGAEHLLKNLPEVGTAKRPARDSYYWYYGTQAMFQMRGKYWEAWNSRFHPLLCSSQVATGKLAGSWHPMKPVRDRWGSAGGRHYVTAMHVLMLEVYYRHLPLFKELGK